MLTLGVIALGCFNRTCVGTVPYLSELYIGITAVRAAVEYSGVTVAARKLTVSLLGRSTPKPQCGPVYSHKRRLIVYLRSQVIHWI